jgi:hypothetical protein
VISVIGLEFILSEAKDQVSTNGEGATGIARGEFIVDAKLILRFAQD